MLLADEKVPAVELTVTPLVRIVVVVIFGLVYWLSVPVPVTVTFHWPFKRMPVEACETVSGRLLTTVTVLVATTEVTPASLLEAVVVIVPDPAATPVYTAVGDGVTVPLRRGSSHWRGLDPSLCRRVDVADKPQLLIVAPPVLLRV